MAERSKKPAANGSGGAPKPPPKQVERMPADYLARRSAAFVSMTQGAGKPMCYPSPARKP